MNTTPVAAREALERVVHLGRVHCSSRPGGVSVEECWMCEALLSFEIDRETEVVRCADDPPQKR